MAVDPMVEAAIYERYPGLRALLGIPEVGDLLVQAVNPVTPFSQQEFERRLHETTWWKTTPAPGRDYIIQGIEDPATQQNTIDQTYAGVEMFMREMGMHMLGEEMLFTSAAMMQRGTTLQDPGTQRGLLDWMKAHPERIWPGGRVDTAIETIAADANQNYFVRLGHDTYTQWAMDLAMGVINQDVVRTRLTDVAYDYYPHLRDRISKGETPAQIINPMRQVAADELELGLGEIDVLDSQWSFLTGMADPDNAGTYRLPTYSEVQRKAREQSQWWQTAKGQQTDAGLSRTILEAFGRRAF